jgi:hypothetical protein
MIPRKTRRTDRRIRKEKHKRHRRKTPSPCPGQRTKDWNWTQLTSRLQDNTGLEV